MPDGIPLRDVAYWTFVRRADSVEAAPVDVHGYYADCVQRWAGTLAVRQQHHRFATREECERFIALELLAGRL